MLAGIAHDVQSCQESYGREHGVRSIEQGHLTLVVGRLVVCENHVKTRFVCRELPCQLFDGQVGSRLNNPKVEGFSLNYHLVGITHFLLDSVDILAREAGDDTVHKRSTDITRLLKPLAERLVVVAQVFLPKLDVLANTIHKVMPVLEDEFARHDDKSFGGVTVEGTETVIEQLSELARIRGRRSVVQATSRVKRDASLGGVGDDKAHIGQRS